MAQGYAAVTGTAGDTKKPAGTIRRVWSSETPQRSGAFEDAGDTLAATDTHRDEAVLATDTLQLVQRLGSDEGTGTADRVAEGDSATVRVGLDLLEGRITLDAAAQRLGRLVREVAGGTTTHTERWREGQFIVPRMLPTF